jgi:hypothetical protein
VTQECFRGIKAYSSALGYKSSASLKTSHPHGFSCEEKSTDPIFKKRKTFAMAYLLITVHHDLQNKLNVKTMKVVGVIGVLQHPAFVVGQTKRSKSGFFYHYKRSTPFRLQFSGGLRAWAPQ